MELPLNTDWTARMVTHERNGGGPELVVVDEMTWDYWGSDEYSTSGEDHDSEKSMFGDL